MPERRPSPSRLGKDSLDTLLLGLAQTGSEDARRALSHAGVKTLSGSSRFPFVQTGLRLRSMAVSVRRFYFCAWQAECGRRSQRGSEAHPSGIKKMIASSEPERVKISRIGRMAFFDGQSLSTNPYAPDDERYSWWINGYKLSDMTVLCSSKA